MSYSTHRAWGTRAQKVVAAMASTAIAAAALLPGLAQAAGEITYSADTNVALGNGMVLIVRSGSIAKSVTYGQSTLTVVMADGSSGTDSFIVDAFGPAMSMGNSNDKSLTVQAVCAQTNGLSRITAVDAAPASGDTTYIITPSLTGCGSSIVSGGGGGGGSYVAPVTTSCNLLAPTAGDALTAGAAFPISWSSVGTNINDVLLTYSVDGGTTYGLLNPVGRPNSGAFTWVVPNTASTNVKVKLECRDIGGATLSTSTSGAFTIAGNSTSPTVPAPTPSPAPAPTPVTGPAPQAAPIATLIHDPSQLDTLLSAMGAARSTASEAKWSALLHSDALQFKVGLTAAQLSAITNFVTYGASPETAKLGTGERRALIRDYMETVGRSDVNWDDIQRMTVGQKPLGRNLPKEQAKVTQVQAVWLKFVGHNPIFQDPKEDLGWNTLMYRIRFTRDLNKERAGILKFQALYKRVPTSTLDWAAVRAWGYAL